MTRYTPQWLQAGSYPASLDRRLISAIWPTGGCSGCAVTVGSGMTVNVAAGQVAVPTQNNSGGTLCTSDATEQVTLAAAPASGTNRIDLVICQPRGNDLDGGANTDFIFTSVTGAAQASPVAPAVPAGAIALAQIYVAGGSASVVAGNITDVRTPLGLAGPGVAIRAGMYRNAAITMGNPLAVLAFDTAEANSTPGIIANLNTATCRFIIPITGRYLFSACLGVVPAANANTFQCVLRRNGAAVGRNAGQSSVGFGMAVPVSKGLVCVAGDYLDVATQQSIATASNVQVGPDQTWANLEYLGPIP